MRLKREVRENDRSAPRLGKAEFSTMIINSKVYNKWVEDNPEYKDVSYSTFQNIWIDISKEVRNFTCDNALGIYMPFHTGELKIQFIPSKVKAIDILASEAEGDKIHQLNIHTKGKIAKITWQRKAAARFNKMLNLFGFEQNRDFGKQVNNALYKNPEIYRTMKINKNRYDHKSGNTSVTEEGA
jgi:hypothetical protein